MTERLHIRASRRFGTLSPLRYPGGKASLAGIFTDVLAALPQTISNYVEPYAGGAGAAIALLQMGYVERITINDIDPAVYAFWKAVTHENERFVSKLNEIPLTISEWQRQREIYRACDTSQCFELGFAFFYLNRTNRSGVLNAGVIGGKGQNGKYRIDARFNRLTLTERLESIAAVSSRITVTDHDGRQVIQEYGQSRHTLLYIDPPYVRAGSGLYLNAFDLRDHRELSRAVRATTKAHWLVTYDWSQFVSQLYADFSQFKLELNYSAHYPGKAQEVLIASSEVSNALNDLLSKKPTPA